MPRNAAPYYARAKTFGSGHGRCHDHDLVRGTIETSRFCLKYRMCRPSSTGGLIYWSSVLSNVHAEHQPRPENTSVGKLTTTEQIRPIVLGPLESACSHITDQHGTFRDRCDRGHRQLVDADTAQPRR
jgi:hypothetical protein